MTRYYTAPDGEKYPLTEAKYNISFKVYKSDRRKAITADPHYCLLALGIRRDPDVADVYVCSYGDAYVIFKATPEEPAHAVHFTLSTPVRRIIDAFDKDKKAKTQEITLRKPTKSRTLNARSQTSARWREEVKNGTRKVQHRGKHKNPRVTRIGVRHRPRPEISSSGNVSMAPGEAS